MSELKHLLKGVEVEWKELGEIGEFQRGKRFVKTDLIDEGVPTIHYGEMYTHYGVWADKTKSFVSEELVKSKKLRVAEKGDVIIVAAGETIEDLGRGTAWLGNEGVVIHDACFSYRSDLNPKYASYFTRTRQFHDQIKKHISSGKISAINSKGLSKVKIAIPPLNIQQEIVRILDSFTELTAELTKELTKELTARKQQYSYYRQDLFSKAKEYAEPYQLEQLCSVITDGSHSSPKSVDDGYYMPSVKNMRSNSFDFSNCKQISKADFLELVRNGCKPQKGDVLIAKDGSMLKYAFPIHEELDIVILSSIAIFRPHTDIVLPKYLAHYFRQEAFKESVIREYSSKGGVPRIVLKNFKKITLYIPTLSEQNRIVSILDKFDTLTTSISENLPKEIELRQKQYEYYRDMLLTFSSENIEE